MSDFLKRWAAGEIRDRKSRDRLMFIALLGFVFIVVGWLAINGALGEDVSSSDAQGSLTGISKALAFTSPRPTL